MLMLMSVFPVLTVVPCLSRSPLTASMQLDGHPSLPCSSTAVRVHPSNEQTNERTTYLIIEESTRFFLCYPGLCFDLYEAAGEARVDPSIRGLDAHCLLEPHSLLLYLPRLPLTTDH
ncbi:hypothetical protein F4803DRAFT_426753 [Xylaria telfairii]|nr:hypothetical protein F4803DRAFT_426753 [Xylaria telfairii]